MEYISVSQFAEKYGIAERTARNYCANGKIEGVFITGKTWNIPVDAFLPKRKSARAIVSLIHHRCNGNNSAFHRIKLT